MKSIITMYLFFTAIGVALCQASDGPIFSGMQALGNGISVGAAIAIVASWSRNKSVLWAIIHGFLGWFYVIYYVVTRSSD